MSFKEWKINFSNSDVNFNENNMINNIIELSKSFSTDFVQTFKLRDIPENIFDNMIGKYIAYIMLTTGFKINNFNYNSYWLENIDFVKKITEDKIIFKDMDLINVEFWFKCGLNSKFSNRYHIDTNVDNDNNKILPIFTSVIYLNNSIVPTLILDKEKKSIGLCFPEYLKTITFDGKKIHGSYNELYNNESDRILIGINVYEKPIKYTPYLDINQLYQSYYIKNNKFPTELPLDVEITINKNPKDLITKLEINSSIEQYEDYCNSIYTNNIKNINYKKYKKRILSEINNYVNNNSRAFNIKINTNISEWVLYDTKRYSDSDNDSDNGDLQTKFNSYDVKYKNVFLEKSILSRDTCDWLITEANTQVKELYGEWKNDRHIRYPTYDIAVDKLKVPVTHFILNLFSKKIGKLVIDNFNISNDYTLNIVDVFIVKYEENKQRALEFHHDDTDISVVLLLSNENSFTGGGTQFETGLSVFPKQGDMLLFGSKFKHQGLEIKSGVRMILTFFINVEKK